MNGDEMYAILDFPMRHSAAPELDCFWLFGPHTYLTGYDRNERDFLREIGHDRCRPADGTYCPADGRNRKADLDKLGPLPESIWIVPEFAIALQARPVQSIAVPRLFQPTVLPASA